MQDLKKIKMKKLRKETELKILEIYDNLPPCIKKILGVKDKDFYLRVVWMIDNDEDIMGQCRFYTEDITIYIKIRDERKKINGFFIPTESFFYHECGHAIHYKVTSECLDLPNAFMDIYNEEKEKFISDYGNERYFKDCPKEYFAQSFAEYMLNPEKLKENTPKTYEYMDSLINFLNIYIKYIDNRSGRHETKKNM